MQEQFGLAQGPRIGALLESLREAQAVGQVRTRDEAETLIRGLLAEGVSEKEE